VYVIQSSLTRETSAAFSSDSILHVQLRLLCERGQVGQVDAAIGSHGRTGAKEGMGAEEMVETARI